MDNPRTALWAIVKIIRKLPPWRYVLGLPRPGGGNQINPERDYFLPVTNLSQNERSPTGNLNGDLNLIINAAHALNKEKIGTIRIKTGTIDNLVWIEFRDNGCGIPPENLTKIFDPFFTTKPIGIGTGLGLSISYGIIQKHGGHITVTSKLQEGTCFRIELPIYHEKI